MNQSSAAREGTPPALSARSWKSRPVAVAVMGILAVLIVAFAICEAMGWPFLASPLQRWLGSSLARPVALSEAPAGPPVASIHLLGRLRLSAPYLRIGSPSWSTAPHMLVARDAHLTLSYLDLWRAGRGEPLRIRELRASALDGHLERLADGRASWQFGRATSTPDPNAAPMRVPTIERLQVADGRVDYRDAPLAADLAATFSLVDGSSATVAAALDASAASAGSGTSTSAGAASAVPSPAQGASGPNGLNLQATGHYRKLPMTVTLTASGVLPVIEPGAAAFELPVTLKARIGGAALSFAGTATDAVNLGALKGRFDIQGPSLAAVGDPLGVTLPTTGPFKASGLVAKSGLVWNVVAEQVDIGASRLAGAFTYDPRPSVPLLSGQLRGSRLALVDLGPAVGATTPAAPEPVRAAPGRVLPDRAFDLPALRAMNANVLVDIADFELGSTLLEPLRPLRTHLVLDQGVLRLLDLDARTAQGRLAGWVQLDGRNAQALWTTDLNWSGVQLQRWIHQTRAANAPPYVTGELAGRAQLAGQGKSTATILGSLHGTVRTRLVDGTVSHLAIEAAGLDVAQALGVLVKGDDALPVQCSIVDLVAEQGVLHPRVLVLDTSDSTLWIDGGLSLASEALNLRVVVAPKDFSPLALRTPLHVTGTFAQPHVSLEKGKLGAKLGTAALLALINPLAAIIPLIDPGSGAQAKRGDADCRALAQRRDASLAKK